MSLRLWVEPDSQRNRKASMGTNGNTGNTFLRLYASPPPSSPFRGLAIVSQLSQNKRLNELYEGSRFRRFGRLRAPELMRSLVESERLL